VGKSGAGHQRGGVCLSCHKEIPQGRFVYRAISKVGDYLGMIPKTDADHQKLIGKAMFIAANVQIFGILIAVIVILLAVVYFARRKKPAD
jgi:ascorbate-specific PTS system EIIC-type component UlaA